MSIWLERFHVIVTIFVSVSRAKIDWNLEATFLQHLQQQADETLEGQEDAINALHIYPAWVSVDTCSTECVDSRDEEEFCVATSHCEHSTWRKAFDSHSKTVEGLNGFELPMSESYCEVWGALNRCDGTLCDDDLDC